MGRRQIIIIGSTLGVIMLIFVAVLVGSHGSNKSATDTPDSTPANSKPLVSSTYQTVSVSGIEAYKSQFGQSTIDSIQVQLYERIQSAVSQTASTYTGQMRAGSFQTDYAEYDAGDTPVQVPTYSLVVDIPAVQQSYNVSFSGGSGYPYNILYVTCPSSNQLIYPVFSCNDESSS